MLYAFLKILVRIALWVFYRKLIVNLPENMPKKGPLIVVSNHPNTLMDPIVIASFLKPQIYFLAKGTLFNSPFKKWLLSKLNMIPIYRKQDLQEGVSNEAIFEKCFDFLEEKGTILIFPEGTSIHERNLRELKTGTARIALGAEAQNNFQLGVQVLSIGLNYSDATRFRSDLVVNVDEPIQVADFQSEYEKDSFEAVRQLTEQIREKLSEHIIISRNQDEDRLALQIEDIYKGKLFAQSELPEKERDFQISKNIVEALKHFSATQPERVEKLKTNIEIYENNLDRLKIKSEDVEGLKVGVGSVLRGVLYLLLGFPLYVYGLLHNYLPYIIPSQVANFITKEVEYLASFMMVIGMFVFPIFYGLEIWAFQYFVANIWIVLLYAVSLPLSGFFVLHYWNFLINSQDFLIFASLFRRRKTIVQRLLEIRWEIINELEKAKEEWLALTNNN